MAVFYLFYRLMLSRDTWHRLNRIVLLGTAVVSFLLPLCIITFHKTVSVPFTPALSHTATAAANPVMPHTPWWHTALLAAYLGGVLFVLVKITLSIIRLRRIIKNAHKETLPDGTQVLIMDGNGPSFSWMGHIIVSRADWQSGCRDIIRHENAHVSLGHSFDVMLVDIISAAQWFNPAIWLLRMDLRAVHEFEADDAVLRAGTDLHSYQRLLISKAAAMNGYTIANNFNHSILKNRIFMMEKKETTARSASKALWLLPMVCICLAVNAKREVNYVYDYSALEADSARTQTARTVYNATLDYDQPQNVVATARMNYDDIEMAVPANSQLDQKSLMELIPNIPGVEVSDDGTITVNGKTISKVLVDGQPYTPQEVVETLSEPSASTGKDNSIYDLLTGSDKLDMSITMESDPITVSSSSSDPSIDILKALYQARIDGMDEQESKKARRDLKQLEKNLNKANNKLVRMERRQERQLTRNLNRFLKQNPDAIENPELIPQELMTKKSINAKVSTKQVDLQALGLPDIDLTQRVMSDVSVDSQNNMFINGHKVSRILINGEEITPEQFEELASLVSPQE
ncbi:MAG: hypothetical protein J6V95_07975 [Bacteroidaceae bacterium]|nr:hypothetical protein [Bacteroidaceae bacterium]